LASTRAISWRTGAGGQEEDMGRIVVTEFVSLDGVMEDPGGTEGYRHGGWSFAISRGPEGDRFKLEESRAADALLLGRRTYEGFAAAWPARDGEFADKFNSMPKYVVSKTIEDPSWNNTTVIGSDDQVEEIRRLHESADGELQVHGSAQLAQLLLENDLIDQLRLMVYPVLLGEGRRLFGAVSEKKPLRLTESRVLGDGVSLLVLEPLRAAAS
jgi:dihydrofolate reductase